MRLVSSNVGIALENRPVSTFQEHNGSSAVKFESVWTLPFGCTTVPMNEIEKADPLHDRVHGELLNWAAKIRYFSGFGNRGEG